VASFFGEFSECMRLSYRHHRISLSPGLLTCAAGFATSQRWPWPSCWSLQACTRENHLANDSTISVPTTQLTRLGGTNANPQWSSDGRRLAFDTTASEVSGEQSLRILDLASGNVHQVTRGSRDQAPRWAGNRGRLVFGSFRAGNADIFSLETNGGNATRLTDSNLYDSGADVSPDGSMVAWFAGNREPTDEDDYGDSDITTGSELGPPLRVASGG
jgi:Tol biopolymer transport system component